MKYKMIEIGSKLKLSLTKVGIFTEDKPSTGNTTNQSYK